MKVVHIKWHDSSSIHGWRPRSRLKRYKRDKPLMIDTVGLLVHESKSKVLIIQSHSIDEVSGVFEIPRGCIRSMTTLCKIDLE